MHTGVGHQCMHEFAVHLDVIRFQNIEDLETFLVDAVMLEREAHAEFLKLSYDVACLLDVPGCIAFRQLRD